MQFAFARQQIHFFDGERPLFILLQLKYFFERRVHYPCQFEPHNCVGDVASGFAGVDRLAADADHLSQTCSRKSTLASQLGQIVLNFHAHLSMPAAMSDG